MNILIYSLAPLLHLTLFSGLLGLWVVLVYRPDRHFEEIATRLGTVLAILLLIWIAGLIADQGQIPVLNVSQMLVFLAALIWWGQNFVQRRVRQRMLVMLPLCVVIVLLASSIIMGIHPQEVQSALLGKTAAIHIFFSMAGITFLLGSGVFGAGQLLLHRQIKRRNFGRFFGYLPSLSDLNKLRELALIAGWLLVTISLISAMTWMTIKSSQSNPVISHLHPMLTLWVVVTIVAAADRFKWFNQQRIAVTTTVLSVLVFILLIVSVIEIYGWGIA